MAHSHQRAAGMMGQRACICSSSMHVRGSCRLARGGLCLCMFGACVSVPGRDKAGGTARVGGCSGSSACVLGGQGLCSAGGAAYLPFMVCLWDKGAGGPCLGLCSVDTHALPLQCRVSRAWFGAKLLWRGRTGGTAARLPLQRRGVRAHTRTRARRARHARHALQRKGQGGVGVGMACVRTRRPGTGSVGAAEWELRVWGRFSAPGLACRRTHASGFVVFGPFPPSAPIVNECSSSEGRALTRPPLPHTCTCMHQPALLVSALVHMMACTACGSHTWAMINNVNAILFFCCMNMGHHQRGCTKSNADLLAHMAPAPGGMPVASAWGRRGGGGATRRPGWAGKGVWGLRYYGCAAAPDAAGGRTQRIVEPPALPLPQSQHWQQLLSSHKFTRRTHENSYALTHMSPRPVAPGTC